MCQSNASPNPKVHKINTLKIAKRINHASDIVEIILEAPKELKDQVLPCQFFNLGLKQQTGPILKRPISVSRVSEMGIHFVIKELGEGTKRLTQLAQGDEILAVGPLGNGISDLEWTSVDEILLIGGGIGTAPLLELGLRASKKNLKVTSILGFLEESYLEEAFAAISDEAMVCTVNQPLNALKSYEESHKVTRLRGLVTEGIAQYETQRIDRKNHAAAGSVILAVACGPDKMLKAIKEQLQNLEINLLVVTEERMACGMGACLVCAKKVIQDDEIKMLRTCVEGPVFKGSEVVFE